jgi:hypothetical protein
MFDNEIFVKENNMGPRQFKTCVYSAKPSDDLTGPGPPLAEKNLLH